jgi:UDP-N-acetylmuramyl tripeptide synthase
MKIIAITGTKGKTTITRALSYVISRQGEKTLRVDTDGYYINEKQRGNLSESLKLFGLVPTVCPGKYLIAMKKSFPDFTAILETALGCSRRAGLGYASHNIGIFSNVLEDHLGSTKRLKKRSDIAKAKQFIFTAVKKNGTLIFNADDKHVCSQLKYIPKSSLVTLLPIGLKFRFFDLKKHLSLGGQAITIKDACVIIKTKEKIKKIINPSEISWTFNGAFQPSLYNLMFILGGIYAYTNNKITKKQLADLKKYKLAKFGGRLTILENKKTNVKIIIDFAHEKYSLVEIGKLAKKLSTRKTIGIVRLAPDRTSKMLFETGQFIANSFDDLIVYDKIDGINRKVYKGHDLIPDRHPGDISKIFLEGILSKKTSGRAEQIIIEESAIKKAATLASSGDIVVVICGKDHKKTIGYVKKYFNASFTQ